MADGAGSGALRPRVVFGAFVALVVAVILFTPDPAERRGDPRLTSTSAAPQGARGLAETLRRVGWIVSQRDAAMSGPLGVAPEPRVVHAVLAPPTELRASEVGALLAEVRRGGALLAVVTRESALADSLGHGPSAAGVTLVPPAADTARCPSGPWGVGGAITWGDDMVHTLWLARPGASGRAAAAPPGSVEFLTGQSDLPRRRAQRRTVARGFPLGRGRVVVVADPDLLRNDVLRVCGWGAGVAAVRMAEWLAATPGVQRRIVFDEFHQGEGSRPRPMRVVSHALIDTRGGRATLQIALAALVLLVAVGVRALPPSHRARLARRSPLEHVDALARAYAQVGASRLVARRLARGLRRRHGRGAWRARGEAQGDAAFLRAAAARHPRLAGDVERLLRGVDTPDPDPRALAAAAAAVDRALTPRTNAP